MKCFTAFFLAAGMPLGSLAWAVYALGVIVVLKILAFAIGVVVVSVIFGWAAATIIQCYVSKGDAK